MLQPSLPFDRVDAPAGNGVGPVTPCEFDPGRCLFLRHPRAKRYVIRVRSDGIVRVTIPRWGSRREARAFAERQRGWIARQLSRAAEERARPIPRLSPDVERSLRARAGRELPARLLELAAACRLAVSRVSVRNQKWRWGSCSPRGHICLNWRLVLVPDWVRDYVLIHELMHLKRMDHSPRFWQLVAAACPEHRAARAWLRRGGGSGSDACPIPQGRHQE